jgi:nucleoside 2-deoxyribosyltransferase
MPAPKPVCFFVMPFSAEMHYFYLYVRKYVEGKHNLICERADDRVTTLPLSEKVRGQVQRADVIIADCTGRNPNVMYELGLAHAYERKVVLLTRDAIDSIPSDLRQFEFVKYDQGDHLNFLQKLDGALDNIFKLRYEEQFSTAQKYFKQLTATCPTAREAAKEEFAARYRAADAAGDVISPANMLVFITSNHADPEVMTAIVGFEPKKEDIATETPGAGAATAAAPEARVTEEVGRPSRSISKPEGELF